MYNITMADADSENCLARDGNLQNLFHSIYRGLLLPTSSKYDPYL
jgi:hypothetical protein